MMRSIAAAAAAATFALATHAQSISKQCPFTDICYSLSLPTTTFTRGGGGLFFQISGPDTYSWIALGQGSGMEDANIFVIYADGAGNVTLSPRLGLDMVEPMYNPDANVTLLAGSGVRDGRMIANVHCTTCDRWQGGSMNLKSDIGMWIGAGLPGPPLDTMDKEAHIQKHFVHAAFPWSIINARGGNSSNPFMIQHAPPNLGGVGTPMAIAHGVLASLAFLAIFPLGGIFVRFARFPGLVWVHASIQVFGYLVYVAAAGLGIHMVIEYPMKYCRWDLYHDPHPKVGMALLAFLFLQATLGPMNHFIFGKKGKRWPTHYVHIWGGRLAIILGIINGGFGLRLGKVEYAGYRSAYGVVATVMGIVFVASIIFAESHRDMPNPSLTHRRKKDGPEVLGEGEGQGHLRMESMDERERLHAGNADRVE